MLAAPLHYRLGVSSMNDPMWVLGDFSVEVGFGDDQDRMMVATTMECASSAYSRLALYKTMSDLLWSL